MSHDDVGGRRIDVRFASVGAGHSSARRCDARMPNGFLCGKPSRSTGPARSYCAECEAARLQRQKAGET